MRDLSLSILDLVQNSVRFGASMIEISIECNEAKRLMSISVKDNGCGMNGAVLKSVTDPFFTTCNTHKVGLGIPLFIQRALLTGGGFRISSEEGKGTVVSAYFKTDSVDFVPLGDMKDTLECLIVSSPNVDFAYSYRDNKKSFLVNTKALFDALQVKHEAPSFIKAALIKKYLANKIIQ